MNSNPQGHFLDEGGQWGSWDLNPVSYFSPECVVAPGMLSSGATTGKLADNFSVLDFR